MKSDSEFFDRLSRVVKQNFTDPNFDVASMAAQMQTSDRQLQRKTKALIDQSPIEYLRRFRLEESLQYLRQGISVGQAAKAVGFSSHAYFTSCFKARYGAAPSRFAAR